MAEVNPLREAYRREFPTCQCCQEKRAQEIHEIASGPAREQALKFRETWLHLCRMCHNSMHNAVVHPIAYQAACKAVADPEYWNLAVINSVRGRAENATTWAEVAVYLELK